MILQKTRKDLWLILKRKLAIKWINATKEMDAINAWQSEYNSDYRTTDAWLSIIKNALNVDADNKHLIDAGM